MNVQGPTRHRPVIPLNQMGVTSIPTKTLLLEQSAEKQVFEDEFVRIRRENMALQDHLQRALKELKAFQVKFPSAYSVLDIKEQENLPPWTTSVEIVSPLFDAYDIRKLHHHGYSRIFYMPFIYTHYFYYTVNGRHQRIRGHCWETISTTRCI